MRLKGEHRLKMSQSRILMTVIWPILLTIQARWEANIKMDLKKQDRRECGLAWL